MSGGTLIVVPTPVGNLGDMTPRALEVLQEAHLVLAEDTRTTGKLLRHFGVDTPLKSFHQHNEHRALEGVIGQLQGGSPWPCAQMRARREFPTPVFFLSAPVWTPG